MKILSHKGRQKVVKGFQSLHFFLLLFFSFFFFFFFFLSGMMAVKGLSPALLPDARVVSSLRNSHWLEFIFGSGKSLVLTVAP